MDKRSFTIKKLLKTEYPEASFSVRIKKSGYSETIYIHTSLISYLTEEEQEKYWLFLTKQAEFSSQEIQPILDKLEDEKRIKENIYHLLRSFYHVDHDEITGEILLGGNTYIQILPL